MLRLDLCRFFIFTILYLISPIDYRIYFNALSNVQYSGNSKSWYCSDFMKKFITSFGICTVAAKQPQKNSAITICLHAMRVFLSSTPSKSPLVTSPLSPSLLYMLRASITSFTFNTLPYDILSTNHCLLCEWTFSTDTPSLFFWMEGVLGVTPTL